MGEKTAIAWTTSTFNPWIGCTKVGPGCDNCYAESLDRRFSPDGRTHWGNGVPRYRTTTAWSNPAKWNRRQKKMLAADPLTPPWRVFCASFADVFDNEVPDSWRNDLWALIRATPHLTWQLVTKRVSNIPKMLPADWTVGWPNVHLIISVVNQAEADRDIPRLIFIPAAVHGVSYEPALGPVDFTPWLTPRRFGIAAHRLDWIIVGGESGAAARPFHGEWAEAVIAQTRKAAVAVFVKQLGDNAWYRGLNLQVEDAITGKGDDPAEWPAEWRVREFPT